MTALGRPKIGGGGPREPEAQKSSWMVKMQSPRVQCCLCACCVMSAVLGMFMLSAGVCLVLNYNFLDVDTSGLPSDLHNDEGKKVVGIILISVGVFATILSGVVSTLYFTACTRRQPHTSVGPENNAQQQATRGGEKKGTPGSRPSSERGAQARPSSRDGQLSSQGTPQYHHHLKHLHGNGGTPGRNSPSGSRRSGSLPETSTRSLGKDGPSFSRGGIKNRAHASGSSARPAGHRRGKKGRHGQGRYKNPLAPHPEEAGAESQSLGESRRSTSSSRRLRGHVNPGAELEDELEMTQESVASGASSESSSVSRSALIQVGSSPGQPPSPQRHSIHGEEQETRFIADPPRVSRLNLEDEEEEEEDEADDDEDVSGRMSRSTMDSQDLSEDVSEEAQAAKKRLDHDILELIT